MTTSSVFQALDVVAVLVDVPASGDERAVRRGGHGTIVEVLTRPSLAYMVEFDDPDGDSLTLPILRAEQIALVSRQSTDARQAA
jgi:hypothetical protein